ncbi:MAG: HD-GYP domain-containing protein [Desulfobacterales bacterium]|nr:HD-GYP domain-containing protein [Pseudomonadota bacterium]MBU4354901.1 HD-GYP domain-containing protein [Pseudomonadota bacterium]MCG2772661.1 HD-GYP domain-containing protein [Desulfobacterales bacterium]
MEVLMQVLESTMATRDPYTVGHQRRVSQIACSIAREMGLSEDRLQNLRMAGTLHDLGKFAIPSDLLSKPGKLTPQEFALIKTHPQVAYNILEPVSLPGNTAQIILQHHERLNGSGYPQGLKGEEILLEARILGVADVMEAMCSHRPYRASLGLTETLDELTRNKGILYDAAVAETCLKLYGQDLAAPRQVSAGPASLRVVMPLPLVSPGDGARAQENLGGGRTLPQVAAGKSRHWARLLPQRHRSWMLAGSASLMGWLIMTSLKGF